MYSGRWRGYAAAVKRFLALGAVAAVLAGPSPASAAPAPFAPCGPNGLVCATLNVPVDYPGATLGRSRCTSSSSPPPARPAA